MNGSHKIVPSLWFDKETEEAINLYLTNANPLEMSEEVSDRRGSDRTCR